MQICYVENYVNSTPKRQRVPSPSTAFASHDYYVNRVYKLVVLRTKKELPVLEYIDRGYVVTDNDRADMPTIYKPDNRRTDTPATQIDKTPC